mmetsp:Transcript_6641/g.13473  ORF Transcript_6641/g.13473 Transcript_6641/m.13473 type:complete len:235 (+) Transcript_6641:147-851(+)
MKSAVVFALTLLIIGCHAVPQVISQKKYSYTPSPTPYYYSQYTSSPSPYAPAPTPKVEPTTYPTPAPTPGSYCPPVYSCKDAFAKCKFTFDGYSTSVPAFSVDKVIDRSFTPRIVSKTPYGPLVGHVDSTGQACVVSQYYQRRAVPISLFRPAGLSQSFSPSFFKSFGYPYYHQASGIGRETAQGNQAIFLKDVCVIVPLTAYQVLSPKDFRVIDNIHPTSFGSDCVAFIARTA